MSNAVYQFKRIYGILKARKKLSLVWAIVIFVIAFILLSLYLVYTLIMSLAGKATTSSPDVGGFINGIITNLANLESFALAQVAAVQGFFGKYSSVLDLLNNF